MSSFNVGDVKQITVTITDQMVRQFAEVSGDFNPIHMDEEYAKTTRFGGRIAHGMFSAALISRVLGMELGPGGIYRSQTLKFMAPIFVGETIDVVITVQSMHPTRGIGTIETIVRKNPSGEIAVKGEATIMAGSAIKA